MVQVVRCDGGKSGTSARERGCRSGVGVEDRPVDARDERFALLCEFQLELGVGLRRVEGARGDYGVVFADPASLQVDDAATRQLRTGRA